MSSKATKRLTLWFLIWIALVLISAPLMASETETTSRSSKSISFKNDLALDEITRGDKLKIADIEVATELVTQGSRTDSIVLATHIDSNTPSDIYIFDAKSELISDFNYNGFYHRFSVSIDADTVFESAYVYAKIYLSYEGGPWNYYATSETYDIYGDRESDRFVIESELIEGFPAGYYDIRIELYDAYHDIRVDTYGPYDDGALLELPLEDSYHDDDYYAAQYPVETEVLIVGQSAGAMSWLLLTLPAILFAGRRFTRAKK